MKMTTESFYSLKTAKPALREVNLRPQEQLMLMLYEYSPPVKDFGSLQLSLKEIMALKNRNFNCWKRLARRVHPQSTCGLLLPRQSEKARMASTNLDVCLDGLSIN